MIRVDGPICLISDVHWGKSKDSELRLKLLDSYLEQLTNDLLDIGIGTIFVLGDWFDNRNTIHVKTGHHYSYRRLKNMSRHFKIYMIPGNHDFHLKTHSTDEKINSIEMFSEIDNVHVFTSPQEFLFDNGKTGLMVPWDTLPEETKKYDYLFGHFEWTGARLVGSTITEGVNPSRLLQFAPTIFSGHIHLRIKYEYNDGIIYSMGCPLELDWGDVDNIKGVYILDPGTSDIQFLENETSPRHKEILYSKIENEKSLDLKYIKGNFVKLVVDKDHQPKRLMELVNEINTFHPLRSVFTEFVTDTPSIGEVLKNYDNSLDDRMKSIVKLPLRDQITTYVELNRSEFQSRGVDIEKLKKLSIEFFDKRTEKGFEEDDE